MRTQNSPSKICLMMVRLQYHEVVSFIASLQGMCGKTGTYSRQQKTKSWRCNSKRCKESSQNSRINRMMIVCQLQYNYYASYMKSDSVQETEVMDEYDVMSDVSLRQLLKRLEKENTELEWQIKEHAWRLDQASTVHSYCNDILLTLHSHCQLYRLCAELRKRRLPY